MKDYSGVPMNELHVSSEALHEWEKRFDSMFDLDGYCNSNIVQEKVKSFIRGQVVLREKEIITEVEKKSFRGFAPYEQHYLIKKVDVLSILKH